MNRPHQPARAAIGLAKGAHPGPVAAVTLAAAGLARASGADANAVLRVSRAVLAGQLAIGWQNDWIDATRDLAADRADKPVVTGATSEQALRTAAAGAAVACLAASVALGRRGCSAHLTAVASAAAYNVGLKGTRLSPLPYGVSFGLLPVVASGDVPAPTWLVLAAATLGMAAHFINVLPDREDDRALGVMGLPQRIPPGASLGAAAILLLCSSASTSYGRNGMTRQAAIAFLRSLILTAAALVSSRVRPGKMPFRVLLVAAVIQVAELARSGGARAY